MLIQAVQQSTIEGQLSDGREWLFDTVSPSLADVSVFAVLDMIRQNEDIKDDIFDKSRFPNIIQVGLISCFTRMASHESSRLRS
jgi:hypothetical protein